MSPNTNEGDDMALHQATAARELFEAPERTGAAAVSPTSPMSPGEPAAAGRDHIDEHAHHRTGDRTDEATGQDGSVDAEEPEQPDQPVDVKQTVLNAVGGPWGIVASAIPTVVFATAIAFISLPVSIGISIAVALVIAGVQLRRGLSLSAAAGGLIGVATAGGVSALTGSANDFFLLGIWAALAVGAVTLASMLAGRPLTGAVWNAVHGGAHAWREDRPTLRAHHIATLAVTLMCAARFVVKQWFYLADSTGWLAVADTVLGFPLTGLVAVVVVWAFRRSTKRLITSAEAPAAARS